MELKPLTGRPRVDLAIRGFVVVAFLAVATAAVLLGDLRQVITVATLAAFVTIQLLVLSPAVDRALHILMWTGLVAWLALALG